MANRITQGDLETLRDRINMVTGSPQTRYTKTKAGPPYDANIGHYHLNYAYGGVKLSRIMSAGGSITNISTGGYGTKRELYNWMGAFLSGLGD
jgi:hypothetical protein